MGEGLKLGHRRGGQMEAINSVILVRGNGALTTMTVAEKEEMESD